MENYIDQHNGYSKAVTRDFFKNVYSYMFAALAISGSIAYVAGNEAFFSEYFLTPTGISPLFYVVAFAPVGLGLLIQSAYRRLSLAVLMVLFIAY